MRLERSMPYRVPKKNDQSNVIFCFYDEKGTECFLDWSLLIKAPVTKVMSTSQVNDYITENGYSERNVAVVRDQDIQDIAVDNKAGSKGEWILWSEIIKLYT